MDRSTAEALLEGELQIAPGIAAALLQLSELDRGVQVGPRPLQQVVEDLFAAAARAGFILDDLGQIRAQQQGQGSVDQVVNVEQIEIAAVAEIFMIKQAE